LKNNESRGRKISVSSLVSQLEMVARLGEERRGEERRGEERVNTGP